MDENNWVVVEGNFEDVCDEYFNCVGDQAIAVTEIMQIRSNIGISDIILYVTAL